MAADRLSTNSGPKKKHSAPPDYSSLYVDSPPLFLTPLKYSLSLSKTCPSVTLPSAPNRAPNRASSTGPALSYVKLKNLKNKGTLLKCATTPIQDLVYDPFNHRQNPIRDAHNSKNLSVCLQLDQDSLYLPGLFVSKSVSSTVPQSLKESLETQTIAGKSLLSGRVVIVVKTDCAVPLHMLSVRLSCYSSEVVCLINPRTRIKSLEFLRDRSGSFPSHYYPTIQHTASLDTGPDSITLLAPGTHVYPFSFIIGPNSLPASMNSHVGSTSYRVESLATVAAKNTGFETIFLTKGVAVKRVLPLSDAMRHESILNETVSDMCASDMCASDMCIFNKRSWNSGLLEYSLFISTKLIELGKPFRLNLHLLKRSLADVSVESVSVSVVQSIGIPCVETDAYTFLNDPHVQKNTFPLRFVGNLDQNELLHTIDLPDLVVSPEAKTDVLSKSLHPYHCEESALTRSLPEGKRPRLEITHYLQVRIVLRHLLGPASPDRLQHCVKVPVLLASPEMCTSFYLPPYRECPTEIPKALGCSDSCVSLPAYTEIC